ncbi:MAG: gliding motility-associated C-terminal domain-containing protein [Flavobacteriales bacterium]|nr:gliding motility-associated C-terminal domain-containing protein [Flavobacteriales bacterium]MBK7941242.1 gliding motility-associated C-terminal domain-containing protein [Flavobacteriales bacterium]MBK8948681.1 gliding motility-associated C-terminal domain-containing protein [Flavobacteriales bacterium]MBK9701268.1 gliding motility-associated C-terminal domain-containing protein [Flavobacteriales bacterium]
MDSPLCSRLARLTLLVLLLSAIGRNASMGQGIVPTMGTEFWLGFMKNYQGNPVQSLDIFISSPTNTSGLVEMPLMGFSQAFTVTANVTTTVTIPLAQGMHQASEVVEGRSVLVRTQDTVAVFAINFEQFTADAAVIYPVQSLGSDYRIMAYPGLSGLPELASEFLIVARQDDTEVEITPTATTFGGQPAGVPFTVMLDSGQTYQVIAANELGDFTGTVIRGTPGSGECRTFAVFSGSVCTNIPDGCFACDHVVEQNLPRRAWGTRYYSVPFSTTTQYTYRVLADQDGTQVTVNGGPPLNLNAGQFVELNSFPDAACFEGNLPFVVAQFMEGITCGSNGDPAMLLLNAEEQRIDRITFATVVSTVITNHYVNIIVQQPNVDDVVLDGVPVPSSAFTPYPACPTVAHASLPLPVGSHTLECIGGLTAYVYGMGSAESYAYSVGSFTPEPILPLDTVLCLADTNTTITLSIPEPLNDPYWTTQSDPNTVLFQGATYTFTPTASDVYIVTGTSGISGCEKQFFFSIELAIPPIIQALASGDSTGVEACLLQPVQLGVDVSPPGTYVYSWSPGADLNDPSIADPVANPAHTTWYTVQVSTLNGCAVITDSVLVTVVNGDVLALNTTADPPLICSGEQSQLGLTAQQVIQGLDVLDVAPSSLWNGILNGSISNACGSVAGNALYFDGPGQRSATAGPVDVSTGGTVRFAIKIATGTAPCEDADPGEHVVLEYSTNGGGAWTIMDTYYEYAHPTFTVIQVNIPGPAQTANTLFRWRQLANGGVGEDNWSLDDVAIATNTVGGLTFTWTPAATLNDPSIVDPLATPPTDQWYAVNVFDAQFGCTYTDSVFVQVGQAFDVLLVDDTTICSGGSVVLNAQPTSGTGHSWSWSPGTGLNATFLQAPTASPTATITYFVTVTNAEGCVRTDSVTVQVDVPLVVVALNGTDPICSGSSTQLTAVVSGGQGGYSYTWSPPTDLNDPSAQAPVASPDITTAYTVTVTDTLCATSASASVTVNVIPGVTVDLGPDQVLCPGASTVLSTGLSGPDHAWSTGATTSSITVDQPGSYWVQVTLAQCGGTDTVDVSLAPDPGPLDFDAVACPGDSVLLIIPYEGVSYTWSGGATTRGIVVGEEGSYGFSVTDAFGCTYSGVASVIPDPLGTDIVVPNVFSPNGDGANDRFEPQANGSQDVEVSVYDRWGTEVFRSTSLAVTWDGNNPDRKASEGTYFYVIRYTPSCDDTLRELRGHVTVLR